MKKLFPLSLTFFMALTMLFIANNINAQVSDPIFTYAEDLPEYKGGQQKMWEFLYSHIQYPQECMRDTIEGEVHVNFVVEKNGEITSLAIAKSSGNEQLDAEAMRVIALMGKWKPGKLRGKAIRVSQTLPIKFMLQH